MYFIFTFADGCGEGTVKSKNPHRKDAASIPKRRVSDGNNPLSADFTIRSRPSSFHDAELTTVPEVTISPYEEDNASEDSSRSPSPTSRVRLLVSVTGSVIAVGLVLRHSIKNCSVSVSFEFELLAASSSCTENLWLLGLKSWPKRLGHFLCCLLKQQCSEPPTHPTPLLRSPTCLTHLVQLTDFDAVQRAWGKISCKGILVTVHLRLFSIWTLK